MYFISLKTLIIFKSAFSISPCDLVQNEVVLSRHIIDEIRRPGLALTEFVGVPGVNGTPLLSNHLLSQSDDLDSEGGVVGMLRGRDPYAGTDYMRIVFITAEQILAAASACGVDKVIPSQD